MARWLKHEYGHNYRSSRGGKIQDCSAWQRSDHGQHHRPTARRSSTQIYEILSTLLAPTEAAALAPDAALAAVVLAACSFSIRSFRAFAT